MLENRDFNFNIDITAFNSTCSCPEENEDDCEACKTYNITEPVVEETQEKNEDVTKTEAVFNFTAYIPDEQ